MRSREMGGTMETSSCGGETGGATETGACGRDTEKRARGREMGGAMETGACGREKGRVIERGACGGEMGQGLVQRERTVVRLERARGGGGMDHTNAALWPSRSVLSPRAHLFFWKRLYVGSARFGQLARVHRYVHSPREEKQPPRGV